MKSNSQKKRLKIYHVLIVQQTVFFEKKIYFHKTNLQKKSYIQYQTHYIQKKKNKAKKRLEILKEGRKRKWGVVIMSFIQSIDIIRSSCSAYILFMQSTR